MSVGRDQAGALLGAMSALIRTTRAVAHRHSGELGAAGTPLSLLKSLRAGDARPSDLATALQVAPSVVSRAIVPLEQSGLVERTADPDDARATRIGLTGLGRARLEQLQQAYVDEVRDVLGSWTDDEAELAAGLMLRLDQAIARTYTVDTQRRLLATALLPTELRPTDVDDDPVPAPTEPAPAVLSSV